MIYIGLFVISLLIGVLGAFIAGLLIRLLGTVIGMGIIELRKHGLYHSQDKLQKKVETSDDGGDKRRYAQYIKNILQEYCQIWWRFRQPHSIIISPSSQEYDCRDKESLPSVAPNDCDNKTSKPTQESHIDAHTSIGNMASQPKQNLTWIRALV